MKPENITEMIKSTGTEARKVREALERPTWWSYSDIYEAYDRPSVYKVRAWERCKELCEELGGWGLRVISKNSMAFTVGFQFVHPETGEICGAYITKDYDRFATLA